MLNGPGRASLRGAGSRLLPTFFVGLSAFLLQMGRSSVYTLDLSCQLDVVSNPVACLFTLLTVSCDKLKLFILTKFKASHFFLTVRAFVPV